MNKIKINKILILFLLSLCVLIIFFININTRENVATEFKIGIFSDSPVAGLEYEQGNRAGITYSDGSFKYVEGGEVIEFFVGGISIGSAMGRERITPFDLAATTSISSNKVVNISRFLQTLDNDSDPENGINIFSGIRDKIKSLNIAIIDFDQAADEFAGNTNITSIISELDDNIDLVSTSTAIEHLQEIYREIGGEYVILSTCRNQDDDPYDDCATDDGGDLKEIDCDDHDPYRYPGNPETCDNKDNDCDEEVDEGCDDDDDGYCDSTMMVYNTSELGHTCALSRHGSSGDDCDDTDNDRYPGNPETCDNKDNNCDSNELLDEGINARPTEYNSAEKGICKKVKEACVAGEWQQEDYSTIDGYEETETSCGDGEDNDCDDKKDCVDDDCLASEHCQCVSGDSKDCGPIDSDYPDIVYFDETNYPKTICKLGTQICSADGAWGECDAIWPETSEQCNDLDDDCDGAVDEDLTQLTENQEGLCSGNSQTCVSGGWENASGYYTPTTEVCDPSNEDEDCDGAKNEECDCADGATQPTENQNGLCFGNSQNCASGGWVDDADNHDPIDEVCDSNNEDENCDGAENEGCDCADGATQLTENQNGLCSGNSQNCASGAWVDDADNYGPVDEVCDSSNEDEDCNGHADCEDFQGCFETDPFCKPAIPMAEEIENGVKLTWTVQDYATDNYKISYYSSDLTVTSLENKTSPHTISGLIPGKTYHFTIQANRGGHYSIKSEEANITLEAPIAPEAPSINPYTALSSALQVDDDNEYSFSSEGEYFIDLNNASYQPITSYKLTWNDGAGSEIKLSTENTFRFGPFDQTLTFQAQVCNGDLCSDIDESEVITINYISVPTLLLGSSGNHALFDILIVSDLPQDTFNTYLKKTFDYNEPFSFFNTKPIKAAKDKFNIWYRQIPTIDYDNTMDCIDAKDISREETIDSLTTSIDEEDIFNIEFNKYDWVDLKVYWSNSSFTWPHANRTKFRTDGEIDIVGEIKMGAKCSRLLDNGAIWQEAVARVMTHEAGHAIFLLNDEYDKPTREFSHKFNTKNCISKFSNDFETRWSSMLDQDPVTIGDVYLGCGPTIFINSEGIAGTEEAVVACHRDNIYTRTNSFFVKGISNLPNCDVTSNVSGTIQCVCDTGNAGTFLYRPTSNSTMRHQKDYAASEWLEAFGPVNQYYIQEIIDDIRPGGIYDR